MNTQQVYDKYNIPLNLQQHMLRVAALSQILVEKWSSKKLDSSSILHACLFHDMANIIKFDFSRPLLFTDKDRDVIYWKKVQSQIIEKFGENIHLATLKICREIGLNKKVLKLIENLDWDNTLKMLESKDIGSAISIYCDMRIGPAGIMTLTERIDDLETRNKNHDMTLIRKAARLLENTLQKHISIGVNTINDSQLNSRFPVLLKMKI